MALTVSEIFSSIQGEGKFTGYSTTFIRLYGCNCRCLYCDSMYAVTGRRKKFLGIDKILYIVTKMRNQHICITGGEPLLQAEELYPLIYELVERGYKVGIETNGTIKIDDDYPRSYFYTMDVKCPSSGMEKLNVYENLLELQAQDEVKFVISDLYDYEFAKNVLQKYPTKASIIFSPVFGNDGTNSIDLVTELIAEDKPINARIGLQLHRFLNVK